MANTFPCEQYQCFTFKICNKSHTKMHQPWGYVQHNVKTVNVVTRIYGRLVGQVEISRCCSESISMKVSGINIQLFLERLSEKVHATIPKGTVVGFEGTVLQRNLKEWYGRPRTQFASTKGSNKSRFDSFSRYEQCIDHIPYYLSGLPLAHFFRQPFSKQLYTSWRLCDEV